MRINATPMESLGVWKPATAPHPTWSPAERERFAKHLAQAIESSLLPAIERYRSFLDREILPVSRLRSMPGSPICRTGSTATSG